MSDFRRLNVWQSAHRFARVIYRVTDRFPAAERYILTSQLRRASASISANIAESCGRSSAGDQRRFLEVAQGSGREVFALLILARDVGLIGEPDYAPLARTIDDIQRMLSGMVRIRRQASGVRRQASGTQKPDA